MLKLDMNSSFKDSCILCHHPGKHLLVQHKIIPGDPFLTQSPVFLHTCDKGVTLVLEG